MPKHYIDIDDDIAAVATASGRGAIAVIRVSGPESIQKLSKTFSRPKSLLNKLSYQALFGQLINPSTQQNIDDVVLLVFKAPNSYTGQDGIDIMCHGGDVTTHAIMKLLTSNGFRQALAGEFTFRAFYNGKIDLSKAQAVAELIDSETDIARSSALNRLHGGVSDELLKIKQSLIHVASALELRLDYGEDEAPEDIITELPALYDAMTACKSLAKTYSVGKILKDGVTVALAGPTNAGKSSLFNLLLKEERSIVSPVSGTTRDYIEALLDLDGIPVRLIDTAGLRLDESPDAIEAEGIRRSILLTEAADLILYIVDASVGLTEQDELFLKKHDKIILVWNKIDKIDAKELPQNSIPISVYTGSGEKELVQQIHKVLLDSDTFGQENKDAIKLSVAARNTSIASKHQHDALEAAANFVKDAITSIESNCAVDMAAIDIASALSALADITGETTSQDILDNLFANFCVGK